MAKNIVGIDISSSGIRAVEVSDALRDRPTVQRFRSATLPDGAVVNGEVIEPRTVATALRQLWSTGGFTSKDVVLGMGNSRVLARDLTVPKMSLQHIRESLPFQVQEMLPVPVEDALLDFYPVSESITDQGPMINGLLVAAVKESVVANVRSAELAGLNPVEVDLIPFALSRVLLRGANAAGTAAVIEVGASTSTVVIASNGVPQFVRIIATGGNDVTEAIKTRLGFTLEQAESSKRALGLTTPGVAPEHRPIVETIYEITGELMNSIRNTLSYYATAHPSDPVRQILLTGGGSLLSGFAHALSETTRIPVVAADPFAMVAVSKKFASESTTGTSAATVALGLALGSAA
jgi:type IV pilus assembly protein PilM